VQAAERLKVTWSEAAPPFPEMAALYDHIRQAPVVKREVPVATGEIDPAFSGAARVVEAEYEWPFQSHASMGPACAIVDVRADGATLWTGSQKPHFARDGVARVLGLPQDQVHGIWVPGPGSYERLRPLLPILLEAMERHGHVQLVPEVRARLLAMSAATIDRALRDIRQQAGTATRRRSDSFGGDQAQRAGAHVC
jgi:hypothetical protein